MKLNYKSFPAVERQKRVGFHREVILVVLSAICLFAIARWGGNKEQAYPTAVSMLFRPLRTMFAFTTSMGMTAGDITDNFYGLQEQLQQAQQELKDTKEALLLAERRETQLRLSLSNSNLVVEPVRGAHTQATVVGKGGQDYQALIIDKGSDDGLALNMPVFVAEGLLGRLDRVLPTASRVLLLQDQNSAVGAEIRSASGEFLVEGLVYGTGSNLDDTLRLEVIGESLALNGTTVYTSSLSVFYPPGLRIGKVERSVPGIAQVFERYVVQPFMDIGKVRQVFVLTGLNREDALSLLNEEGER